MERVEFSNSFKSFIEQTRDESKVSRYLSYYLAQDYSIKGRIVARHIKADKINYLTFRKDGTISYLPFGRELKRTDNGEWARDGRQEGKPAKTITQILSSAMMRSITSRDLEIFSNFYKGRATALYTIKEARGEALADVYSMPSPFGSCMKGPEHRDKLELYVKNPDVVGVLYVERPRKDGDEHPICDARALIWTDIEGNKIIDRVYGREEFSTIFRDYATEIGAYKKQCESAGISDFIFPDGHIEDRIFEISISHNDCEKYPYVDTFYNLNEEEDILTNDEDADNITKVLQSQYGNYDARIGYECLHRDGVHHPDLCSWSSYHNAYIHDEDVIEINGDYYYEDDGSVEDAFEINRRSYVLENDCRKVEVIDPDLLDGLTIISDVDTTTMYKTPDGDLIDMDTNTVKVFVIDGEVIGKID